MMKLKRVLVKYGIPYAIYRVLSRNGVHPYYTACATVGSYLLTSKDIETLYPVLVLVGKHSYFNKGTPPSRLTNALLMAASGIYIFPEYIFGCTDETFLPNMRFLLRDFTNGTFDDPTITTGRSKDGCSVHKSEGKTCWDVQQSLLKPSFIHSVKVMTFIYLIKYNLKLLKGPLLPKIIRQYIWSVSLSTIFFNLIVLLMCSINRWTGSITKGKLMAVGIVSAATWALENPFRGRDCALFFFASTLTMMFNRFYRYVNIQHLAQFNSFVKFFILTSI